MEKKLYMQPSTTVVCVVLQKMIALSNTGNEIMSSGSQGDLPSGLTPQARQNSIWDDEE